MTNFKDAKGIHASGAPANPFRYRGRKFPKLQTPKQRAKIQWMLDDFESYHAALLRKLSLGNLPKRAAKYGCADFDLEDECEYSGDDGTKVQGRNLAGIAAYVVRSAKDPIDYLFSLRKLPAMVIEPIRAYLRVKLAMGRLKAEIGEVKNTAPAVINTLERENITVIPADAKQRVSVCSANTETSQEQNNVEGEKLSVVYVNIIENGLEYPDQFLCSDEVPDQVRDDRIGNFPCPSSDQRIPTFKWHTSPAKVFGFKEMQETYGYDPRDTSVYWIEKRANALRRKWKRHEQALRGVPLKTRAITTPKPEPETPATECSAEPEIRYFQPVDADYNSVWPPVDMPAAPTTNARLEETNNAVVLGGAKQKLSVCSANTETSQEQCSGENNKLSVVCYNIIENRSALPQPLPCFDEVPDQVRDDRVGNSSCPSSDQQIPIFKWHKSPSKVFGFKEMQNDPYLTICQPASLFARGPPRA